MHGEATALLAEDGEWNTQRSVPIDKERIQSTVNATRNTPRWVTTFAFALIFLDLAIYGCIMRLLAYQPPREGVSLEIRDSYVGLDELYNSGQIASSPHGPIITQPRRVGQIFKAHPHEASPMDVHRWLSVDGTMSPTEEHLKVSADTRTVLQFRATDYGMESCQLALRLPSTDQRLAEPFHFRGVDGLAMLDVCELEIDELVHLPALTWATRPACKRVVGTFSGIPGNKVTMPRFPCKSRSLYSYEIACSTSSPDCLVDVWAEQNQTLGIFMYQYQTV